MSLDASIAVILINWNGIQDAAPALASVRAQTRAAQEVVVVDNGSVDGSREWFQQQPGVQVLANSRNLGFAAAVNRGLAASSSAYVCLCNLDVRLDAGFLEAALARAESDPRIGTVAGRLRHPPEGGLTTLDSTGHVLHRSGWVANRDSGHPDRGQRRHPEEVFGASAAAVLYRRRMLQDVALDGQVLAEDLFAYLEDVDLDFRARWAGWRCWYEPEAGASHRRGGSGLHRTSAIERHVVANRITVYIRNAPPEWLRGPALGSALALFTLRAARALLRHPAAALGVMDAVLRLPRSRRERARIVGQHRLADGELARWARPTPWARLLRVSRREA
ncbi:MAG: glycosyltransferase family 2 protein [Candidatus Dormibacteria bacterium]